MLYWGRLGVIIGGGGGGDGLYTTFGLDAIFWLLFINDGYATCPLAIVPFCPICWFVGDVKFRAIFPFLFALLAFVFFGLFISLLAGELGFRFLPM